MVAGHLGDLPADPARPCADEPAPRPEPVRVRDRGRMIEPIAQRTDLRVEVGVERQRLLDEQRRDEDDAGTAVRGEPAGEVECVLRLVPAEERDDDAPEAGRGRPPENAADSALEPLEVRAPHRSSWYGTLARMTCGSNSSSRLM